MRSAIRFSFPFLLIALSFFIIQCGKKPEVAKSSSPKAVVLIVGGLGESQCADLFKQICGRCPEVTVVNASDWDGYSADLSSILQSNQTRQNEPVVLIGHSFGGEAVNRLCDGLGSPINLLVLIDPVAQNWGDFELSRNQRGYLLFYRSEPVGPKRARIPGVESITITGGHNDLPHNSEVINQIINNINELYSGDGDNGGH